MPLSAMTLKKLAETRPYAAAAMHCNVAIALEMVDFCNGIHESNYDETMTYRGEESIEVYDYDALPHIVVDFDVEITLDEQKNQHVKSLDIVHVQVAMTTTYDAPCECYFEAKDIDIELINDIFCRYINHPEEAKSILRNCRTYPEDLAVITDPYSEEKLASQSLDFSDSDFYLYDSRYI